VHSVHFGTGLSMIEAYTNSHAENLLRYPLFAGNLVHSVHSGAQLSIIEPFTKTHAENTLLLRPCGGNFGAFRANTS